MHSFRTELENPVVEKDIIELEKKIHAFRNGVMDEDRFRSLRLARGIYGQRQEGVQMVRIKMPLGQCSTVQLRKLADVSDRYSTGNLHITTRQDIQIHYVSLDKTPQLWTELEESKITLREACGNTVRNITASPFAGVDPEEAFDVSPYAKAMFEYFLRNPVCQDMGRKFKIAFSSSDKDDAYTFAHDLGFIPKIAEDIRGFRVVVGGGIGSQPRHADLLYDFLPSDQIIPLTEAVLRVFDRYGERLRRHKARLKFLIDDEGLDTFKKWVDEQSTSMPYHSYPVAVVDEGDDQPPGSGNIFIEDNSMNENYSNWLKFNVFTQKQPGFVAVGIKIPTGDFSSEQARKLAGLMDRLQIRELRFTANQGILLRFVETGKLKTLHKELVNINLGRPGFNTLLDIVACPGTDTCNLGIASSMGLARELESMLAREYSTIIHTKEVDIKISGCMNACGQHTIADIGFQGMTMKAGQWIAPATQVLLGGGRNGDGSGRYADKVTKVPSKRVPAVLRVILDDFIYQSKDGESFGVYYNRMGTDYFYQMLKIFSDTSDLQQSDFIDWGEDSVYEKAIGIGECAGVIVDLVATLLLEGNEKLADAQSFLDRSRFADSIYCTYTALLYAAKAVLTTTPAKMNTQAAIIRAFDEYFPENHAYFYGQKLSDLIYQINMFPPSYTFAYQYLENAKVFLQHLQKVRNAMAMESNIPSPLNETQAI